MLNIGFTGSRHGITKQQKRALTDILWCTKSFSHGDCIGADEEAHIIAVKNNVPYIFIHPPTNEKYRAFCHIRYPILTTEHIWLQQDYLERNRAIVDTNKLLIAAPNTLEEQKRSGTWYTVRYARKQGVPVIILDP